MRSSGRGFPLTDVRCCNSGSGAAQPLAPRACDSQHVRRFEKIPGVMVPGAEADFAWLFLLRSLALPWGILLEGFPAEWYRSRIPRSFPKSVSRWALRVRYM
jgi:hypothetical protein